MAAAAVAVGCEGSRGERHQGPHRRSGLGTVLSEPPAALRAGRLDLTAEDYHYLYYGYAYQPQYRPLETNPALDRFYETLARLNVDAPADTDLLAVIEAGTGGVGSRSVLAAGAQLSLVRPRTAGRHGTGGRLPRQDEPRTGDDRKFGRRPDGRDPMAYPDVRARLRPVGRQEHSGARARSSAARWSTSRASRRTKRGERVLFRLRPHLLEKARTGV